MKSKITKALATLAILVGIYMPVNAQWSNIGNSNFSPGPQAMCSFNGYLYAGTAFSGVMKWNGTTWVSAGIPTSSEATAMTAFDSVMYVACSGNIYQVTSTGSVSTIATIDNPCYALCFYNHKLYAGGWMDSVGAKGSRVKVGHIATYSAGKWDSIPVELDYWPFAMTIYNGQLAVGGEFNYDTKGDTLYGVGLWNGTSWTHCKHGITGNGVYSIGTYLGNLIIGGGFDSCSHVFCKNIAQWNGSNWSQVGTGQSGTVYALGNFNGSLVAGGYYDSINSWNGSAWSCLGSVGAFNEVQTFCVYNTNLYAGGQQVNQIGGVTVTGIGEYTIPTGINQLSSSNSVMVYPNPNNGEFTIQLANSKQLMANSQLEVYNVLGEEVFTSSLNAGLNNVNLGDNAPGIYLYRILSADGNLITTGRVIVK